MKMNKTEELKKRIFNILLKDTLNKKTMGYTYVYDVLCMCCQKESLKLRVVKEIYPKVANMHNTTPSRVERLVRHSLKKSQLGTSVIEVVQTINMILENNLDKEE